MSTIPLAKALNVGKMTFPALLSEKFDGVPVLIKYENAEATAVSRQGKPIGSVDKIMSRLSEYLRAICACDMELIGEVIQTAKPRAPFRDTGGIVRRQEVQEGLSIMIFDGAVKGDAGSKFPDRMLTLQAWLRGCPSEVAFAGQFPITTPEHFEHFRKLWTEANPDAEGMILRSSHDIYEPGKRQWGYQKVLNEPTIDLRIVGLQEAVDKHGEPKGMVGGLIAEYNGEQIGIGPGKLTHKERQQLWEQYMGARLASKFPNRIAEIKHKGDESYDALRQPTFQHWRDDKETPDA